MITSRILCLLLALGIPSVPLVAQELDLKSDDSDLESLYDRLDEESDTTTTTTTTTVKQQSSTEKRIDSLTGLARLQTFEDIAVIQRRFLPKTGRFEFSAAGFTNLNNPFFNNLGGGLRLAYHFSESWGLEALGNFYGVAARQVTEDLKKKASVDTANTVSAKGFFGGALRWNPVYGKISWLNKSIVPFDLGFSAGFGMTRTDESSGEPTVNLGTNQTFAISKAFAVRWDLMWNLYQAQATDRTGKKIEISQNDLFVGIGMSWYFPEATYR